MPELTHAKILVLITYLDGGACRPAVAFNSSLSPVVLPACSTLNKAEQDGPQHPYGELDFRLFD